MAVNDLDSALGKMPDAAKVNADESMTSAGRLNSMLSNNSPLMKQAKTQGMQTANSRGLLNSSMAAGAAQGAMIERASPFALQDSNNLFQNARQNADMKNQKGLLQSGLIGDSYLSNQNYVQQQGLNEQAYGFESDLAKQQFGYQQQRDETLNNYSRDMAQLESDLAEARASSDFGREQQLMDQQARLQAQRDERLATFDQDMQRLNAELQEKRMQLSQALEQGNMELANQLQQEINEQQQGYQQANMQLDSELQEKRMQLSQALEQGNMELANQLQQEINEQQYEFQSNLSDQQYQQSRGLNEQQFNNEMQRMGYAYELDQRNIPQNYAANISAQTLQNVQAIQADPNLEPAAKQAAIKNAIDMANANMSWAETFYNTPMPALRTPGAA